MRWIIHVAAGGWTTSNWNIEVRWWEILSVTLDKYSWPCLRNTALRKGVSDFHFEFYAWRDWKVPIVKTRPHFSYLKMVWRHCASWLKSVSWKLKYISIQSREIHFFKWEKYILKLGQIHFGQMQFGQISENGFNWASW